MPKPGDAPGVSMGLEGWRGKPGRGCNSVSGIDNLSRKGGSYLCANEAVRHLKYVVYFADTSRVIIAHRRTRGGGDYGLEWLSCAAVFIA